MSIRQPATLLVATLSLASACAADPADDTAGDGKSDSATPVKLDGETYQVVGDMRPASILGVLIHGEFTGNPTSGGALKVTLAQTSDIVLSAGYGSTGTPFLTDSHGNKIQQQSADPPNTYFRYVTARNVPAGQYWIGLRRNSRYDSFIAVTLDTRAASPGDLPVLPVEGEYQITEYREPGTDYPPVALGTHFTVTHDESCLFDSSFAQRPLDCYRIQLLGDHMITSRLQITAPIILAVTKYETSDLVNASILGSAQPRGVAATVSASIGRVQLGSLHVSYTDPAWGDDHGYALSVKRL